MKIDALKYRGHTHATIYIHSIQAMLGIPTAVH